MEKRDLRKDGTIVWVRLTRSCVRKSDGSVDYFVAVVEDISARKRAEEQLHLLMREANHRVKNLLSLVQAIARQTAAGNVEGFIGRFTERIQALAANQDLLGRDGGREPIWRTWYALTSRILRTLSGLGSSCTVRSCI